MPSNEGSCDGLKLVTWRQESFGYADGWDSEKGRYRGLRAGQLGAVVLDGQSVLVKPEVVVKQLEEEEDEAKRGQAAPPPVQAGIGAFAQIPGTSSPAAVAAPAPASATKPTRFHGSVDLDSTRIARDAGEVTEEVVQHISGLVGAKVEIALEIHAEVPDGVPESVVRTVTENCRTLKFKTHGFEEK